MACAQHRHFPLIDIAESTAGEVAGFKRLGSFATRFTMQADLFGPALASHGISVVILRDDEEVECAPPQAKADHSEIIVAHVLHCGYGA